MREVMLSTSDNPFNPFKDYESWEAFDHQKGYYSNEYLARVLATSRAFSPKDQATYVERAIDEIVDLNLTGNYIKVSNDTEERFVE